MPKHASVDAYLISTRFEFLQRLSDIGLGNDGIALKDTACAPAADLHDHAFGDSGAAKVARGGPPQIVEKQSRSAGGFRGFPPSVSEIPHR